MTHLYGIECPTCGSEDIDLVQESDSLVMQCQECGEGIRALMEKPPCPLVGTDGNVFSVIANVKRCLHQSGQAEKAQQWVTEASHAQSYDQVLQLTFAYVDPL